ncbi:MAG: peptidylprolyl isomerase [Candidatus Pacearchaeota archaeon]
MRTKKNDLVEVEFTASLKDGTVFDTTNEEEARKAGLIDENYKREFKPLKIFIGKKEVIEGFDKALEGKEIGKEFEIEISAKEGYGLRDANLIRTLPLHAFEQKPVRGMFVNVNGFVAKVISVTGGRILVDFNNPLAGKDLVYKFKILRIIEDDKEKLEVLAEKFNLKIKVDNSGEKLKVVFEEAPKELVEKFKEEARELLGKEIVFESSEK